MSRIELWAPHGSASPGPRVRVSSWMEMIPEVDAEARLHCFTDESAWMGLRRSPSTLLACHRRIESEIRRAGRASVSLVHRELSPLSRGGTECKALELGETSIYDIDDALTHDSDPFRRWRSVRAAQRADIVLAGNDYLAEVYTDLGCTTMYLPSCVDTRRGFRELHDPTDGRLTVGWIGSVTTVPYLELLLEVMGDPDVRAAVRFVVMGPSSISPTLDALVVHQTWTREHEAAFLTACDVGMMPLPDTPWARGKCAYKLLQFGSVGRTFVASPVGANKRLIDECGAIAATTIDEWRDALLQLARLSREEIARLGKEALQVVDRSYSYSAWEPTMRELLLR